MCLIYYSRASNTADTVYHVYFHVDFSYINTHTHCRTTFLVLITTCFITYFPLVEVAWDLQHKVPNAFFFESETLVFPKFQSCWFYHDVRAQNEQKLNTRRCIRHSKYVTNIFEWLVHTATPVKSFFKCTFSFYKIK